MTSLIEQAHYIIQNKISTNVNKWAFRGKVIPLSFTVNQIFVHHHPMTLFYDIPGS